MKKLKMTNQQADLVGESILAKIHRDRDAMDMITCEKARKALAEEIAKLNEILTMLTQV